MLAVLLAANLQHGASGAVAKKKASASTLEIRGIEVTKCEYDPDTDRARVEVAAYLSMGEAPRKTSRLIQRASTLTQGLQIYKEQMPELFGQLPISRGAFESDPMSFDLTLLCLDYLPGPPPPISEEERARYEMPVENEIVSLINEERAARGIPALVQVPELKTVAREWSLEMDSLGLVHRPSIYGLASTAGLVFSTSGENIAMGYASPQLVVDGWMKSQGHRDNILDPNFDRVGVGVFCKNGRFFATQNFVGAGRSLRSLTPEEPRATRSTSVESQVSCPAGSRPRSASNGAKL